MEPWNLPFTEKEIYYHGELGALNECNYRNMNNFNYLMMIDMDELIVPHSDDTIPAMLDKLNSKLKPKSKKAEYNFRNVFFYLEGSVH